MKFHCSQENLWQSVSIVQRAVSTKNTHPSLGCIYLEVTADNLLILRTTDLEISIEHSMAVEAVEAGKVIIPAKYFIDIVRHLPATEITFEAKDDAVLITYFKSRLTINTYPVEEFPNLPVIREICSFNMNAATLKKTIRQVSIATSLDSSRPIFTGVLLELNQEQQLTFVATDTHRLAYKTARASLLNPKSLAETVKIVIPGKILTEISRLIEPESIVQVIIGENNQVVFKFDQTSIFSRLLQGQFPNYRQVMPANFKSEIKINTKEFLNSLERASLLIREEDSKKRASNVKLQFAGNSLTIDSYVQEVGNIHEELNIDLQGEKLTISFNARYLLDVLKAIDEEFIYFKFTGSLSPAIIRPDSCGDFIYLILPVRSD